MINNIKEILNKYLTNDYKVNIIYHDDLPIVVLTYKNLTTNISTIQITNDYMYSTPRFLNSMTKISNYLKKSIENNMTLDTSILEQLLIKGTIMQLATNNYVFSDVNDKYIFNLIVDAPYAKQVNGVISESGYHDNNFMLNNKYLNMFTEIYYVLLNKGEKENNR